MALWYRVSFCMRWLQVHPPSSPFLVFFLSLIYMTMSNSWARIAGKCRPHQSNASGNDLPETYPKFRARMYIHICTLTNTYTNLQKKRAGLPQNKILATFLPDTCSWYKVIGCWRALHWSLLHKNALRFPPDFCFTVQLRTQHIMKQCEGSPDHSNHRGPNYQIHQSRWTAVPAVLWREHPTTCGGLLQAKESFCHYILLFVLIISMKLWLKELQYILISSSSCNCWIRSAT